MGVAARKRPVQNPGMAPMALQIGEQGGPIDGISHATPPGGQ
jgi:hypothetical protein